MPEEKQSTGMSKRNKIFRFLGCRVTAEIEQGRRLAGTLAAFDKHMNLVLSECEETRTIRPKNKRHAATEERKHIGFVLLRGEKVLTLTMDGSLAAGASNERFPIEDQAKAQLGQSITNEAPAPGPSKLAAPAKGVGAPAASSMAPAPRPRRE